MIELKTLDDVDKYIEKQMYKLFNKIRIDIKFHECNTLKGVQKWKECTLSDEPEELTLKFKFNYTDIIIDLVETIVNTIDNFKFSIAETIYDITAQLSEIRLYNQNCIEIKIVFYYNF